MCCFLRLRRRQRSPGLFWVYSKRRLPALAAPLRARPELPRPRRPGPPGGTQDRQRAEEYASRWTRRTRRCATSRNMPARALPAAVAGGGWKHNRGGDGPDGRQHFVRLLTYLPGTPLATVKPHTDALMADLGRFMGDLDGAPAGFDHPARGVFHWDLAKAAPVIHEFKARSPTPAAGARRASPAALRGRECSGPGPAQGCDSRRCQRLQRARGATATCWP